MKKSLDKPDNITLRQWFAGMAMQGLCACNYKPHGIENSDVAKVCLNMADAMLDALSAEPEKPEPSPITDGTICCSEYPNCYHAMQNTNPTYEPRSQPEKPAIDPEIKRVYDHWEKNDGIVVIKRAFEREMWKAIKAHCERG
jgi:hypothetical protein